MPDEPPQLPWSSDPPASWQGAVDAWPWKSLGGNDWGKSGNCPRCDHGITITKENGVTAFKISEDSLQSILVRAEEGPMVSDHDEKPQFFARCDCGEKHPGRPAELSRGCGSWAEIDPPPGS